MSVPPAKRGRTTSRSTSRAPRSASAYPAQMATPYTRGGEYGFRKYKIKRTPATYAKYGASSRFATPVQKQARFIDGYSGLGAYHRRKRHYSRRHRTHHGYRYRGRGGFWGDVWGGIKKGVAVATPLVGGFLPPQARLLLNTANTLMNPTHPHTPVETHQYDDEGDFEGEGDYDQGVMSGMGDYGPVTSNAIVHGVPSNAQNIPVHTAAASNMTDSGDITLSHKEFIQNISIQATSTDQVSSQFTNQVFQLNPGLQNVFPFLSQLAQNFTLYSMQGLMFSYKPTSGEMGANSQQLGKVIMATDYDPQAVPFINSIQMENYQFSNTAKPSIGQVHGVECKPSESMLDMKYIRTGTVTRDLTLTDMGLFQIATEGIPFPRSTVVGTTVVIGELWATYTVKVSRANLYSSLLGYNIAQFYQLCTFKNGVAAKTTVVTHPVAVSGGQPTLSSQLTVANLQSNNMSLKIDVYQGVQCSADSSLGMCIAITFPVNTILGTFGYRISVAKAALPSTALVSFQPSPCTAISAVGARLGNAANKITQWCCPFTPDAQTTAGLCILPPVVNLNTGCPQMYAKDSDNATDVNKSLNVTQTFMQIGGGSVSNNLLNGFTTVDNQAFGGPGTIQTGDAEYGWSTNGMFQVNAPSLNIPVMVLEEMQVFGGGKLYPFNVPIDPYSLGDRIKIQIWAVNSLLAN